MKFLAYVNGSRRTVGALLLLTIAVLALTSVAYAHETRTVGPYTFVVGFRVEPAFEGQINGVDLRIREGEEDDAPPVEGVEETLQVEVTHMPSGTSEIMDLRSLFGQPGRYTNDWIPTAPGQYRFRFFGAVEDLEVDETFESGPDSFGSVEAAGELYFPEDVAAARELESAVRGAQSSADEALALALDADARISGVQTLAIVSIVVAVVALAAAALVFAAVRRR